MRYAFGWIVVCISLLLGCGLSGTDQEDVWSSESALTTYTLTLTINANAWGGDIGGSVTAAGTDIACVRSARYLNFPTPTKCLVTVKAGETLVLTAGSTGVYERAGVFKSWGGACSGTGSTCSLTVNANTQVTATFADPKYIPPAATAYATPGAPMIVAQPTGWAVTAPSLTQTISYASLGPVQTAYVELIAPNSGVPNVGPQYWFPLTHSFSFTLKSELVAGNYRVKIAGLDAQGNSFESVSAPFPISVAAETHKPDPPTGVTLAMHPTDFVVDLSFGGGTDNDFPDLDDYLKILRTGGAHALTIYAPSAGYQDFQVTPGATYSYSLSFTDEHGNESVRTTPIAITVPMCLSGQALCGSACVSLDSDNKNCGACGKACGSGNQCVAGACVCPSSTDFMTDPANCGACGNRCANDQICTAGACAPCEKCGGSSCVDLSTEASNCGACGNACASGYACVHGTCACTSGQTECPRAGCVDMQRDPHHCGGCGIDCGQGACVSGACVCDAPNTKCGDQCVYLPEDPANCGACGHACGEGASCKGGSCLCPVGTSQCGDKCIDLLWGGDASNCGSCGHACAAGQACVAGACQGDPIACGTAAEWDSATVSCPPGKVVTAIDFASYGTPSGACGQFAKGACDAANALAIANEQCLGNSSCTLSADNDTFGDPCVGTVKSLALEVRCGCPTCGTSTCMDLSSDAKNCGACGHACEPGAQCVNGTCGCPSGTADCGRGYCASTLNDRYNCGGCGISCGAGTCNNGACSCSAPNVMCGKTCASLDSDAANCGACGHACGASSVCVFGSCIAATSVCGTAPEWGSVSLACPVGKTIASIAFASYGTPTGDCGALVADAHCDAANTLSVVSAGCVGKASCTIAATNATFGDPCYGTVKRLAITASCR